MVWRAWEHHCLLFTVTFSLTANCPDQWDLNATWACSEHGHPLRLLLSLHFPKHTLFFFLVAAGCCLLVSCGRVSTVPVLSNWKSKRMSLVLLAALGVWAPQVTCWRLAPLLDGESHTLAVCTCSKSSCSQRRLFLSCTYRPRSCISWAWLTDLLLKHSKQTHL